MFTIDASVWISADTPSEVSSRDSRAFLDRVSATNTPVIVPTLLRAEVAGAISRVRRNPILGLEYSERLSQLPCIQWITIDDSLAIRAAALAAAHGLRGADALYAEVAMFHQCELISLDREHLTRLRGLLRVSAPPPIAA